MVSNTNYNYNVTIEPPDNIKSVISAIISFNAQINGQTQNFTLWVNGGYCNTPSYYVATAFSTTGNVQFYFDCSNMIKTNGTYNITLRSTVNTGAVIGWLDLTYMDNPPASVSSIGRTEYSMNENAKVVLHLLDGQGNPVNNGNCYTTIRDSQNNIKADNQTLNYISGSNGIYYYQFQFVPLLPISVYSVDSYCMVNGIKILSADTFHVSINPPFSVESVGGTEYSSSENARIVLQILDNQENPINNGNCYTTIRDSQDNIKTNNERLNYISGSNGLYYYQFLTTLPTGVYSTDNYCDINGTKIYSGDTFHVAEWAEDIQNISKSDVSINFFGTEYNPNEAGTIWLQLLRNYQPIDNSSCYITAYFPNKTKMLDSIIMNYLSGSDGLYYYDFTVPSTVGVYMVSATCYIPSSAFIDDFLDYSKLESYTNVTVNNSNVKLVAQTCNNTVELYPYAWYHLNETSGTSVSDSSGNGRNGNTVNSPTWVAGKLNNSLQFNGVNQYVNMGNASTTANFERTQNFSVETWFKTSINTPASILVSRTQCPTNCRGWQIYMDSGKIYFDLINTWSSNVIRVSVPATYANGNWHHLIVTYNGSSKASGVNIYFDGSLLTKTIVYDTLTATIQNIGNFTISSRNGVEYFFNGTEDEVVIYNKTLNSTEISFRYNNSYGTESMTNQTCYGTLTTSGVIRSIPIINNSTIWYSFGAEYVNNDGSINFKILNSSNDIICSGLGDISSCANDNSPIKLYAEITRPTINDTSPTIDRWWVTWASATIESEIRGSGEIHVSDAITNASINISNIIISHNATMFNESQTIQSLIQSHNNTMYVAIQALNSTITNYYLSLNQTVYDIKNILETVYEWVTTQISVIS
jgi:hypothetical protein